MTDYAGRHPGGWCQHHYQLLWSSHPESLLKSVQGDYISDLVADGATDTGNTGVVNVLTMQDVALHHTQTDCWVV